MIKVNYTSVSPGSKNILNKKTSNIIIISVIVLFIIGVYILNMGKQPLKNLSSSDITLIEISALPPNEVKFVSKMEDIETIVSKLRKVVVYEKVKQNDYNGQIHIYTLVKKDGSKREFMISNPIVAIDGVFYKTKYDPAKELSILYDKFDYKPVKK